MQRSTKDNSFLLQRAVTTNWTRRSPMTRIAVRFGLLVLALTLSISAFAKSGSGYITLYQDATLNGTTLAAGDYTVKYDEDGPNAQVKFMKGKKEVATASGQMKTLAHKAQSNSVVLSTAGSTRDISEIHFGGKTTAIAFVSSGAAAGK